MTWGKLAIKFPCSGGKIWEKSCYRKVMLSLCNTMIAEENFEKTGNLLFSGKQRISLSTNFPVHVKWGKIKIRKLKKGQRYPLSSTKFPTCISYACRKFRRQRKNFPLAWAMREIRGLHSLGEQKNPRRSWYYYH